MAALLLMFFLAGLFLVSLAIYVVGGFLAFVFFGMSNIQFVWWLFEPAHLAFAAPTVILVTIGLFVMCSRMGFSIPDGSEFEE